MTARWTNVETFLNARLVEKAAESAAQGPMLAGQLGDLHTQVVALHVEVVKAAPLPRWVRRRLLERIARKNFGDHPEFSEWWA